MYIATLMAQAETARRTNTTVIISQDSGPGTQSAETGQASRAPLRVRWKLPRRFGRGDGLCLVVQGRGRPLRLPPPPPPPPPCVDEDVGLVAISVIAIGLGPIQTGSSRIFRVADYEPQPVGEAA